MSEAMTNLKVRLREVQDLRQAEAILYWDMATYLPSEAGAERGRQMSLLSRLAHEQFTADTTGELLAAAEAAAESPEDQAVVRITRRDFDRASCLPAAFVERATAHYSTLHGRWAKARPTADFAAVADGLARSLDLAREESSYFPGAAHVMDPLIAGSDYGFTAATVRRVFAELRAELTPLVEAVCSQAPADASCLHQHYPRAAQLAFGETVAGAFGYDFGRGRQDLTHHPFMIRLGAHDVRITTRVDENFLAEALFSTWHETGHALYEQGIDPTLDGTPLLDGASSAVHESQSRLWENLVSRSRGFWEWAYPLLQADFPKQLGGVSLDTFYRAINAVERGLIRVEADELTYNLHVMIRFDLECALLEGSLAVRDLPEAWHARYQSDLGLRAPDDRDGVMQDVHWYGGRIGGCFQGYTLGNIMSAQFYQAACAAVPGIPAGISRGEFAPLHTWLREHLYHAGRRRDPLDLLRDATGSDLDHAPYVRYLRDKFTALYGL